MMQDIEHICMNIFRICFSISISLSITESNMRNNAKCIIAHVKTNNLMKMNIYKKTLNLHTKYTTNSR